MFKTISRTYRTSVIIKLTKPNNFEVRNGKIICFTTNNTHIRYSSASAAVTAQQKLIDSIPEPPPIPEVVPEISKLVLNSIGEPTFKSLGLGGYWPSGLIQSCFELLHVSLDLPWWGAIMIATATVRILMFPLVVLSQRNSALLNNNMPEFQKLQMKATEARQRGNLLDSARYNQELVMFMKEKQINPIKNVVVPLTQGFVFVSFYLGLRGMVNCPVESLLNGGIFWFTDLTVPDQYFILPLVTSFTLLATIEVGADGIQLNSPNMRLMKYFLRALPFVMLPFTMNFPGAILMYWCTSNFISLGQVAMLKIPAVRSKLKIPQIVRYDKNTLPMKGKGFVTGVKDWWGDQKITRELAELSRIDTINFTRAGQGPVKKTYKHDPTKVISDAKK